MSERDNFGLLLIIGLEFHTIEMVFLNSKVLRNVFDDKELKHPNRI